VPITGYDYTGYAELEDLAETLRERGAELVLAGRETETRELRQAKGITESRLFSRQFPTLRQAVKAYRAMTEAEDSGAGPT
jgi:MFS superfamily sulfate permease-like transporter